MPEPYCGVSITKARPMSRIFKQTISRFSDAAGKRCSSKTPGAKKITTKSKTWYGEFRDADDILKTVSLQTTNKTAAQTKLAELARTARDIRAGVISPLQEHADKLLLDHLSDFEQHLAAQGSTPEHRRNVATQARRVISEAKAHYVKELTATAVQGVLLDLKASGLAPRTINSHLQAAKQFCRWMVKDRRIHESPLQHIQGLNAAVDQRRVRRELSSDEIARLLHAAKTGPDRLGLTGWERFTLYSAALGTGLRASELASLTPRSFDLTNNPPTVRIEAANEKARRGDTLPLPADLVALLAPWLEGMPQNAKLWPGEWAAQKRASKFIQADLEAARAAWLVEAAEKTPERHAREKSDFLLYRNHDGEQADFHALRHTFLSRLGRSGASPKVMQKLARHSTVELTLGRYTHASLFDLQHAVSQLPALPTITTTIQAQKLQATGTDDAGVLVTPLVTGPAAISCLFSPAIDDTGPVTISLSGNEETPELPGNLDEKRRGRDSNSWYRYNQYTGLANRRFRPLSHLSCRIRSLLTAS